MNQKEKAELFAALHVSGAPIVLYNAWDAGSASAIFNAGAVAIATSSWSVAAAQGYSDGEDLPVELAELIARRIVETVDAPVSMDFEGGYTEDDAVLAENIRRVLRLGVVGINFEDRVVKGAGMYSIERQSERIAAIYDAAKQLDIPLFINARTDLFLGQRDDPVAATEEALERAHAYAAAGASGLFIPGLADSRLIRLICDGSPLPVNVMITGLTPPIDALAALGVARISFGNIPYVKVLRGLELDALAATNKTKH